MIENTFQDLPRPFPYILKPFSFLVIVKYEF